MACIYVAVIISEKWDVFAAIRRCCFGKTCFKIIAVEKHSSYISGMVAARIRINA